MNGQAARWTRATRAYADAAQAWRTARAAGSGWNPALRVGDADRQQVVAELQRHFVEGRLTSDELGERVNQALAARTAQDLALPLVDLPVVEHQHPPTAAPAAGTRGSWWSPFASVPGRVLLALLAVMVVVWLVWLPGLHPGGEGAPLWPAALVGVFFFGWPGRRRRS